MSDVQDSHRASIGLSIRNLQISFDGKTNVLEGLELEVQPGEIIALVGASGCGKSTLLRSIAGLQKFEAGDIEFTGFQSDRGVGEVSFVFQDATLLPWRTVYENVALPLELQLSKGQAPKTGGTVRERMKSALESVELTSESWDKYPRQLSGGMRMRTSIARALVTEPNLLLLDEPFAALDDLLRTKLNTLLLNLWYSHRRTILFVTHNIAEAVWLSHRIAVFGKKRIVKLLDNPLSWPRTIDQRSSVEFAQQYGTISQALAEAN